MLLVYRLPARPTAGRVAVWRLLKKAGAIHLQQSVCVFPDRAAVRQDLQPILHRIESAEGQYHLLPLGRVPAGELDKLVRRFQEQTAQRYAELVESGEADLVPAIELESARQRWTREGAEALRNQFERLRHRFERVRARDWFGAPSAGDAEVALERWEAMLEELEERVHASWPGPGHGVATGRRRKVLTQSGS